MSDMSIYRGDKMVTITEQFKVGDKVKWVVVKGRKPHWYPPLVRHYHGTIDEIVKGKKSTCAMVKMAGLKKRKKVSLFELEVIG
jgi:hypothetical protein